MSQLSRQLITHLAACLHKPEANARIHFTDELATNEITCRITFSDRSSFHVKLIGANSPFDTGNELIRWLAVHQAPVTGAYERFTDFVSENGTQRTYIRPYLASDAVHPEARHLPAVLQQLSVLHKSLLQSPFAIRFRNSSHEVQSALKDILQNIVLDNQLERLPPDYAEWLGANHAWISGIYSSYDPNWLSTTDAQCVHGDLHPRNILVSADQVLFIDFDESYKTFASPAYDIAYLYSRIAVPGGVNAAAFTQLVAEHYGVVFPAEVITATARNIYLRLLLMVIYNVVYRNRIKPVSELKRFADQVKSAIS